MLRLKHRTYTFRQLEDLRESKMKNNENITQSHERNLKHMVGFANYLTQAKKDFLHKYKSHKKKNYFYQMNDFEFFKTLGQGTFGTVVLAEHIPSSLQCAIKILDKSLIIQYQQVVHVRNEIELLAACKFPFITDILFTFISNAYVCIGMPCWNGGDLFGHLRKEGYFDEEETQFYAGQVVLAFEYLHFLGIVYRDLKPENILLNDNGYLKIVDFGFAKKIDDNRTYTLCGTPDYIAPEILKSKGYGKSVDWWSFGVLVYEMAAGEAPFYDNRIMKTYENICLGKVEYPVHFSKSLKHFLEHLIQTDITKRYGFLRNGIGDIKYHEWFQHFKWDELMSQSLKPHYIPKIKDLDSQSRKSQVILLRETEDCEYFDEFKDFYK